MAVGAPEHRLVKVTSLECVSTLRPSDLFKGKNMFGLGKCDLGYSDLVDELKLWEIKPNIITAFMEEYSDIACKNYKVVLKEYGIKPEKANTFKHMSKLARDQSLEKPACEVWDKHLQKNKSFLTASELAVWAIMYYRRENLPDNKRHLIESALNKFPKIHSDSFL